MRDRTDKDEAMIENEGGPDRKIVTIYDDIYDLPDARAYYRAMDRAGFRTAHHAAKAFRAVMAELKRLRGLDQVAVTDFASGYGIAAALLRHDLSLDDVLARYRAPELDALTPEAMAEADRAWFAGHRPAETQDTFAGIDVAGNALAYGQAVGIFDAVFAQNLQQDPMSDALRGWLEGSDLIVECGSVAHMLPGALEQILRATRTRDAWIVTSPIRGNDTAEALDMMADYGREAHPLGLAPFPHRRFADADEQARAIANARARGHDTTGAEDTGFFHAQIFLARPAREATPVSDWPRTPLA